MKKRTLIIIIAVAVIAAAALFFALRQPKNEAECDLLARVKAGGKLTVAMEGTWQPWTYHNENDELVGFDVEVAKAIGSILGVEVEFCECPWDSIFGGIDAGRYDMAVNGIDWTEERAQKFSFTQPYAYNHAVLIVRSDNEEIKAFTDLSGRTTANTLSSTYAALTESYGASTTGVDDLEQTIELVLQGRVDATANSEVSYIDYITAHPESELKIVDRTSEADKVVIAVRKADDTASFVEAVNAALKQLHEDGTLSALSLKYFGSDLTKAE